LKYFNFQEKTQLNEFVKNCNECKIKLCDNSNYLYCRQCNYGLCIGCFQIYRLFNIQNNNRIYFVLDNNFSSKLKQNLNNDYVCKINSFELNENLSEVVIRFSTNKRNFPQIKEPLRLILEFDKKQLQTKELYYKISDTYHVEGYFIFHFNKIIFQKGIFTVTYEEGNKDLKFTSVDLYKLE